MPAERGVQLVKHAVARHERLAGAALLAGAAVQNDGAAFAGLGEVVLQTDGGGHGARAQQIVAAAVTAPSLHQLVVLGAARFLGQA